MLFFYSQGQLGNQLFQYALLKTIARKNERLVVYGFDKLAGLFILERVCWIKRRKIFSLIAKAVIIPFFDFLSFCRLVTSFRPAYEIICGKYRKEKPEIIRREGLIGSIKYVRSGSFQSELLYDPAVMKTLKIRQDYIEKAKSILSTIPEGFDPVFVHIRRGDFENYTVFGKNTILPISYYFDGIDLLRIHFKKSFIVFLTNDKKFAEENFKEISSSMISNSECYRTDFTIMTLCSGGVMSASTFSYWGAFFMINQSYVYAPKNWLGFKSGIEFPIGGFPGFAKPIEVKLSE